MAAASDPTDWPAGETVPVPKCPACDSVRRRLLYAGLTDRVFGIAAGAWSIYRCADCHSGWLDPRPSDASLPLAYRGYFTHQEGVEPQIVRRKGLFRRILHDLVADYVNHRYGLDRPHALMVGRHLLPLFPPLRAGVDSLYRHLPRLPSQGGALLDIGCGNGRFLRVARKAGWRVCGVDFDPGAVAQARAHGLEVHRGGAEALADYGGHFDVVTSSHVLEHVADPRAHLAQVFRLLRPGGTLWIETPNLDSQGHANYARDWRDLDPPRHLWLSSASRLPELLRNAGFVHVTQRWNPLAVLDVFPVCEALRAGKPATEATKKGRIHVELTAIFLEAWLPARREFLTMTALRPGSAPHE